MTWCAYSAEVFDEEKWKIALVIVSEAGIGVRDMLDSVRPGYEEETRVRRMEDVHEFASLLDSDVRLGVRKTYEGQEIAFENGAVTLDPEIFNTDYSEGFDEEDENIG